jgi:hypothetical protein|tara:strand:- start:153 stop:740 length:588 start_codon:yes stop_codon:yes gene_type:complete
MGGSKPSAPTVIMPAETQPQQFQTVIPEKSFKDLAEQMGRIETETAKIQEQRYDEVGTPSEIGARSKGRDVTSAAAYLASLPSSMPDTSFQTTPRPFDIKSTSSAATTVPGQTGVKTGQSTATGSAPKSQLDYVKDAAKDNLDRAKQEYSEALKLAKTKGRPKPTITKNPSFATQDPKDYLPKRYNPETGNMDIV